MDDRDDRSPVIARLCMIWLGRTVVLAAPRLYFGRVEDVSYLPPLCFHSMIHVEWVYEMVVCNGLGIRKDNRHVFPGKKSWVPGRGPVINSICFIVYPMSTCTLPFLP